MNNYPEIEKLLPKVRAIAEKHDLTDVMRVIEGKCGQCRGDGTTMHCGLDDWHYVTCPTCHGIGRTLRDMSDWPDGALAGAFHRVELLSFKPWAFRVTLRSGSSNEETDDLEVTKAVLAALEEDV